MKNREYTFTASAPLPDRQPAHSPGYARCMASLRRTEWLLRSTLYEIARMKLWPGDLVKLNPNLVRRVA